MATQKPDVDNQSLWKDRYYEALGDIELRETAWREAERLLRHLVTRLSLASDTCHTGLTQNLSELRNAIRDGHEVLRLRELIDQISSQVGELDEIRLHSKQPGHPATILPELLERIALPDINGREVRQLKKQISQLRVGEDAGAIYEQFISLINSSVSDEGIESTAISRKQKLLNRILKRQDKSASTVETLESKVSESQQAGPAGNAAKMSQKLMAPAVGDLLLQLALRLPDTVRSRINFQALKKHTNRSRTRRDLIAIVDVIAQQVDAAYSEEQPTLIMIDDESVGALAQAVQQIITQLNPPDDLRQRVVELEQFYSESNTDVEGLIHCLNTLADVVAEICSRLANQRDELESFFLQLSMRLQDLDLGLQKTGNLYNDSQQDNLHMGKTVHDELRGIQECMQTANEISQIRNAIQSRLDAIDQHLLHFHDAEKRRYDQAQQTIRELGEKIAELESDGSQLRNCLEETRNQTMRDALTGIPNCQAYEERLTTEVARSKRYNTPLVMVVWDVDRFKNINDVYGCAGGDRILKVVADMLSSLVRETDFVARYGGEEFVTIMPQTSLEDAVLVTESLRKAIEETPFHFHDVRVNVTISAGVAQIREGEHATALFERADAALYAAKEAGRNQVKTAES